MALFNDAVYAYRRMKQAENDLESDHSLLASFCDDDERNTLAFAELHQYNKNATFLYMHPILAEQSLLTRLTNLLQSDPMQFMNEITNSNNNIARYMSRISLEKYRGEEERLAWLSIIEKEKAKLNLMQKLISTVKN
jgi:hypothetical protein